MASAVCLALAAAAVGQEAGDPFAFQFDAADETVQATLLENPNYYDAGIASSKEGLWLAWLEFQPGKGDQLWIGLRGTNGWIQKTQLTTNAGDYANPTVTMDADDNACLTYEATETNKLGDLFGNWNVFALTGGKLTKRPHLALSDVPATNAIEFTQIGYGVIFPFPRDFCPSPRANINHRVAADPTYGIWIVWQADALWFPNSRPPFFGQYGRFQPIIAHVSSASSVCAIMDTTASTNSYLGTPRSFGIDPMNSWSPSAVTTPDGVLHVVWDTFDGQSYNVLARTFQFESSRPATARPGALLPIALTSHFEAHAQIASDKNGKLWVSWEEDGENWGQPYVAHLGADGKKSTRMADNVGPLHRFRKLHLAQLDEKNETLTEVEIPQPSFELARSRTNAPAGLQNFGVFYENCQLVVDGQNRPWIVYRHFYVPWLGIAAESHKQENARLYARCLLTNGWSRLFSFDIGQGDGMQRISVSPEENGIAVAWTCGRTDRRTKDGREKNDKRRGVAIAQIKLDKAAAKIPAQRIVRQIPATDARLKTSPQPRQRPATEFAGKRYELFYGDLHRHTDISLCFSPVDGTIDDAYRYAIDVAQLDFLGITDHTHDLDWGEPLAQIWWRSRKEVDRHALSGRFVPFYSYERSRGDTDHNVISLRDDMMRPHTYSLANFWQELDSDTFTIPHQPVNSVTWNHKDDDHRPLMEIYQGFRNLAVESDAHEGLARGHRIGFIASSDHLSTSASYACVWAEEPTRESIFRAMQARRTFGATAKIVLKVTADDHWMGASFKVKSMPPIRVEATGTAPIERMDLIMEGEVRDSLTSTGRQVQWTPKLDPSLTGRHILYVRLFQKDGNRAWSSPMWVEIEP